MILAEVFAKLLEEGIDLLSLGNDGYIHLGPKSINNPDHWRAVANAYNAWQNQAKDARDLPDMTLNERVRRLEAAVQEIQDLIKTLSERIEK